MAGYVDSNGSNEEEAKSILELGVALFYKFVESILINEKQIRNDISVCRIYIFKCQIYLN